MTQTIPQKLAIPDGVKIFALEQTSVRGKNLIRFIAVPHSETLGNVYLGKQKSLQVFSTEEI